VREQRTPVLSGLLYWLLQSSVLTSTDLCLLSSPCHQKSHDEIAVLLYGTSINFFRNELGIAYFSGVSVEYFGVFKGFSVTSFSSHFGVTMEFSVARSSTPQPARDGMALPRCRALLSGAFAFTLLWC